MPRLDGKSAIVTGSDFGIGQAIAENLAQEGADIVVVFLKDQDGADRTGHQVEAAGRRALVSKTDVRQEAAIAALFERIRSELGEPFILVNNAGIGSSGKPIAETTLEEWDDVVRTDLYGPFLCCREFIKRRKAAGGNGKIINITSVHEAIPSPGNGAYGAAKGGLKALGRSLALELPPDRINVNNIAPGLIETPLTEQKISDPDKRRQASSNIPWRRPGQPWEVARLAAYLASDDADYVTGQSFTIDGGLEMNWGQGGLNGPTFLVCNSVSMSEGRPPSATPSAPAPVQWTGRFAGTISISSRSVSGSAR
jgi:glucose 1-dehydrogenase